MIPRQWLEKLGASVLKSEASFRGERVTLDHGLEELKQALLKVRSEGKAVWWVGNGGSSALCSHLSQDAMNKLNLRSQALSDASLLTMVANDFGYEEVYAYPLNRLAQSGDLLIAVSSSGRSNNILRAVEVAASKGMKIITLSGFDPENPLRKQSAEIAFFLPSDWYGLVEVGHEALIHSAIESIWAAEKK